MRIKNGKDSVRSPYLYRDGGLDGTVIDVRMKEPIMGSALNRALNSAIQRFPYMKSKLVEKEGSFYIAEDLISMVAIQTNRYRALGSIETGFHLIDITYIESSIRVNFHHALCDGRGVKPFVETLVYYYCCYRYNKKLDAKGVHLAGEPLLEGETKEPVGHDLYPVDNKNLPTIVKDGFSVPESKNRITGYYRHEININKQELLDCAKKHKATPAILIALLLSGSIYSLFPTGEKPVVCSMAMDYRSILGFDNTHKNCVGSVYLPYTDEIQKMPMADQALRYRQLLSEQKSGDAIKSAMNMQIGLFEKLDQMNSLEEKKQMLAFFNDLCVDTYVLSYLGQMQLGEGEQYVESMHLYNSGSRGLRLSMISAGEIMTVDIQRSFRSDDIVNAFLASLSKIGLTYTVSECIEYNTTKDEAATTAGVQAERYYSNIT